MNMRTATISLFLLLLAAVPAAAQTTYIWSGANPGDWANAGNWSPNGVPGPDDSVVIDSGQPVLHADATVAEVTFSGGMLSGDGNLTVTGTFTWSDGTLNGRGFDATAALTIPDGAALHILGKADKGLRGRNIFNDGTILWEGDGNLVVMWGTRVENRAGATFDIRNDAVWTRSNGSCVLVNEGLLVKSAGTETTRVSYPFGEFVNEGTVRVETGTLLFNNNSSSFSAAGDGAFEIEAGATLRFNQATYSFGAGSTVSGAGTLLVTGGAAQIGRGEVTGSTVITGGTLAFTSTETPTELAEVAISGPRFTGGRLGGSGVVNVNGPVTWTGGYLGGRSGVFNLLGETSAEGDEAKHFGGGTINNAGLFTWTGAGDLVVASGTAFHNLEGAHFDIQNDAVWTRTNGGFDFFNSGLVTKSAGSGRTTIQTPFGPFNNDGEIRAETGTLYVRNSSIGSNSEDTGEWIVEEGAELWFNLHQRTFTETASLGGTGTVRFLDSAEIVNRGTVRPGLSVGTLTVQGNYPTPQAAGVLEIDISGTEPDTGHDQLAVTGTANLAGTLAVRLLDGFEPEIGDAFTVLTADAVSGTFAEVEAPEGYTFDVMYNAQDVVVRVATVIPVELTTFEAATDEQAVTLTWRTASETNNAGFAIERFEEAKQWKEIAFVEGQGTTTRAQAYRFTDRTLPYATRTATYRLKQVDLDGTATYSQEVEVGIAAPEAVALHGNFPNPFGAETTIRYELSKPAPVRLAVYDMLGRRVHTLADERQEAGRKEVRFNAAHLAAGVYFCRLQVGDVSETRKMVLVR